MANTILKKSQVFALLSKRTQHVVQRSASTTKFTSAITSSAPENKSHGKLGKKSDFIFKREDRYGAHNYHPLPVAIERAYG